MTYSQEIGQILAETLNELFVLEEMGIPLNEIRDLSTLKGHLASAEERYGVKHPKFLALQNLHAKKEAAEERKATRMNNIKTRQEFHAKNFGYKPVKGSKRNEWVHENGHKLSFGSDRAWNHMKSGAKRAKGGNATPIRDLHRHLTKLHEDVEMQGDALNEIRGLSRLNQLANRALLSTDPAERSEMQRLISLQRRKRNLFPSGRIREDEEHNKSLNAELARIEKLYGKKKEAPKPGAKQLPKHTQKPAATNPLPPYVPNPKTANPHMLSYGDEFLNKKCGNCGAKRKDCTC